MHQLLGAKTHYWGFAPGPHWGTSIPGIPLHLDPHFKMLRRHPPLLQPSYVTINWA